MIVVFGSVNIDLTCRVQHLPAPGETVVGGAYTLSPGGKGANQALAASRAGAPVKLVGAVGQDVFADAALELLRAGTVDLTAVKRSVSAPTGLAMIAVDDAGENQIVVSPGANAEVEAGDVPADALGPGAVLLAQMELRPDAVAGAIADARAAEARIVVNLAPAVMLSESSLDAADALILNQGEALTLARAFALHGGTPAALAERIAERRDGTVVVTAGADGAYLATGRGLAVHVPAPATQVVDTIGAGDAFVGAFTAAFARNVPLLAAVKHGVAAGALACRAAGAQSALPTLAEIEALVLSL
jgi:ribokinase